MKKLNFSDSALTISVIIFVFLIILSPKTCTAGAADGLLLCGRVIIPSLFPFTVCVLFILKSGILNILSFISPFTKRIFNIDYELFSLVILSALGGYPIGAKLLNEAVILNKLNNKNAGIMLNYCVNAGPAFVILAVGSGIVGSKTIGYILLSAHIAASFIMCFGYGFFLQKNDLKSTASKKHKQVSDNFTESAAEAASAVFGICAYVILFSTVNSYINSFAERIGEIKYLSFILEVTTAVSQTKNIFFISFLLGFGGISVWCQVFSLAEKIKINHTVFALSRIFHGLLSAALTYVLLKLFGVTVPAFSNIKTVFFKASHTTAALSLSMLCMTIIFIISLYTEKHTGKILEDLI